MDRYSTGPWFASSRPEPLSPERRAALAAVAVNQATAWVRAHQMEIAKAKRAVFTGCLVDQTARPPAVRLLARQPSLPASDVSELAPKPRTTTVARRVLTLAVPGAPNTRPYASTHRTGLVAA